MPDPPLGAPGGGIVPVVSLDVPWAPGAGESLPPQPASIRPINTAIGNHTHCLFFIFVLSGLLNTMLIEGFYRFADQ
ncbi:MULTISPECIES: hypothetical protein [unclassified Burkholderia]|uniref:hypothetical protein n=1 Tax=unclassified Burkholderia TaxID=2613784 RepID=UPI00158EFEFD|nr:MULTISPECIES: hypothetical protein [unclassified Burkholderia]